ncbi:MAG: hypothetical protein CTR55_24445 [Pseudomonas sp.]|nr:MAG: hypothetical protein CTR55_24445 [Pseudomonas sp.]
MEIAYRLGYLEAVLGRPARSPTHEVLAASWEAGWQDGAERRRNWQIQHAALSTTPYLTAQLRRAVPEGQA